MQRRQLLATALVAPLAAPRLATAQTKDRLLKFIPESDLTILDPIWTTATVTHNHGYLVFDTLYGQDDSYAIQPQMVAGHTVENDGTLWRLTLRDGLRFHDGEPVRARDVAPSIRRFAARDAFGRALMDATVELSAAAQRTGQKRHHHARHHAGTLGADRSQQAGHRHGRQRAVPFQHRRAGGGRPRDL